MSLKKDIFLNISQIASFIGQNKYDYVTPFNTLWKRYDGECYTTLLMELSEKINDKNVQLNEILKKRELLDIKLQNKKITKEVYNDKINIIKNNEIEIKKEIDISTKKVDNINLNNTQKIQKVLGKEIVSNININIEKNVENKDIKESIHKLIENDTTLKNETKQDLVKNMESFINTNYGTFKENNVISIFENKFKCKLNISQKYNFKQIENKNSKFYWYIGGKCDGINENDKYVVEVKNRIKSFFNTLRDYEKSQIQLYMYILEFEKAKLVECFNGKLKITEIYRDNEYINEIIKHLDIFMKNFERFLDNIKLKKQYINLDDQNKQLFLKKLFLLEIEKTRNNKIKMQISQTDCLLSDFEDDY